VRALKVKKQTDEYERLTPAKVDQIRATIQSGMLISRLTGHVKGELDLTPTQVQAALGLLKKVVPDFAAVDLVPKNQVTNNNLHIVQTDSSHLTMLAQRLVELKAGIYSNPTGEMVIEGQVENIIESDC